MNVGFRIVMNFERPDRELVEQFRGCPVANLDDQMNRLYAMDAGIRPYNKALLCGTAFTVKAPAGDNLMFHKALDMAQEGDIIVVSGVCGGERSFSGEVMAHYGEYKKLGGFVIDGYIRDQKGLAKMDFPIYARGCMPNGPLKNGPGEINVPVACGGQVVFPGDILVGDADGVIVIRPEYAKQILEGARKLEAAEVKKIAGLKEGVNTLNREWIAKALEANRCTIE